MSLEEGRVSAHALTLSAVPPKRQARLLRNSHPSSTQVTPLFSAASPCQACRSLSSRSGRPRRPTWPRPSPLLARLPASSTSPTTASHSRTSIRRSRFRERSSKMSRRRRRERWQLRASILGSVRLICVGERTTWLTLPVVVPLDSGRSFDRKRWIHPRARKETCTSPSTWLSLGRTVARSNPCRPPSLRSRMP